MKDDGLTKVYFSYIFYNISNGVYASFLSIHLYSLGGSLFLVSLLSSVPALITVLATPIWGMLSYRTQKRKVFIMLGLMAKTLCLIVFVFISTPLHYIITLSLFSVLICALQPNLEAFITQVSTKKGKASGLLLTSRSVGLAAGPLVGGAVFEVLGIQKNFILGALFSALALLILMRLKEEQSREVTNSKYFDLTPYRTILRDKGLTPIYLTDFLYVFGVGLFSSLFSVYFVSIGGSKTLLGLTNSAVFIIAMLISTPIGMLADRIGRKPLMVFGNLCCGLLMGVLYFTNDPLVTAAVWAIPLHPYISVASMALIADYTSDKDRAVGIGLLIISQSLARVVGPIIGGLLADSLTLKGVIPVSTLILFLGGVFVLAFIKEKRGNQSPST